MACLDIKCVKTAFSGPFCALFESRKGDSPVNDGRRREGKRADSLTGMTDKKTRARTRAGQVQICYPTLSASAAERMGHPGFFGNDRPEKQGQGQELDKRRFVIPPFPQVRRKGWGTPASSESQTRKQRQKQERENCCLIDPAPYLGNVLQGALAGQ